MIVARNFHLSLAEAQVSVIVKSATRITCLANDEKIMLARNQLNMFTT